MKTISIIYRKNTSAQWQVCARAFAASNFKIKIVDPLRTPPHTSEELRGDFFLLDGERPDLAERVKHLRGKCPDARFIVTTEVDSSRIRCDVLRENEAPYASGPLRADDLAPTIQRLVTRELVA